MRILVASARVPLGLPSYADRLGDALAAALAAAGHLAEHLTVPFDPAVRGGIADALLLARLLELDRASTGRVDRLIALDFPATAVRHDRKVLWLAALARPDHRPIGSQADHARANALAAMRASDRLAAAESRAVHAVSGALAERWRRWCGEAAAPLLPPVLDGVGPPGGAAVGIARPALAAAIGDATAAMADPAGPAIMLDQDADHDEAARAAMAAGRPVVCCTDAGAPLDLVLDGVTGAVVPPDPEAIRAALAVYADDPALARRHGAAGRHRLATLASDWSGPIERLLD